MVKAETVGRRGKAADWEAKTREAKLVCVFTQTTVDKDNYPVRNEDSTSYIGAIENADEFGKDSSLLVLVLLKQDVERWLVKG